MLHVFVNPGQRRLLALFMSIIVLLAFTGYLLSEIFARQILTVQIEEKIAMIGYLAENEIILDETQIEHITMSGLLDGRYDDQQLESGRKWLASYGYEQSDTWSYYNAYNGFRFSGFWIAFLPASIALIIMTILCSFILSEIYRQIRKIANISQQAAANPGKIDLSAVSVRNEGDLAVLWYATAHLAEKAAAQLKSLERDKKYLQNFLSDISHQVKTPLASLQLYLDLMMQEKTMSAQKQEQFIEQGLMQIQRIDWLIQGLLKMARLDAGSVQMKIIPADIAKTVDRSISPFNELIKQKHVSVDNMIDQGMIWPHDPEWLAEAISNIIKNSLEHIPEYGKIEIKAKKTPLSLQLQISDNGPGIPNGEINRIFERFYRHNASRKSDSVGIGLSLARAIFEQNGADLTASSLQSSGAVFTASFLKKS